MIQTIYERLSERHEQVCLFFGKNIGLEHYFFLAKIEILSTVIKRIKCKMFYTRNILFISIMFLNKFTVVALSKGKQFAWHKQGWV